MSVAMTNDERRKDYYSIKEYIERLETSAVDRLEKYEKKIDQFILTQETRNDEFIQLKEIIGAYLRDLGRIEKDVFYEMPKRILSLYLAIYGTGGVVIALFAAAITILKFLKVI